MFSKEKPQIFIKISCIIAISFFTITATVETTSNIFFLHNSQKASGNIIEIILSKAKSGNTLYSAKIAFVDFNNIQYIFNGDTSLNPNLYSLNDTIGVLYNPSNPNNVKINTIETIWSSVFLHLSMVLVFSLRLAYLYKKGKRPLES